MGFEKVEALGLGQGPTVRTRVSSKPCMLVLLAAEVDVHRVLLQTLLVRSPQVAVMAAKRIRDMGFSCADFGPAQMIRRTASPLLLRTAGRSSQTFNLPSTTSSPCRSATCRTAHRRASSSERVGDRRV